jgi:UDP-N-acetyl-2-amino-2-deoxyglucuronate dehydrogenase
MKNFALIGAAGYIAPRHMHAIRDTGNKLAIAYDPNDSVGILDSVAPGAEFHTQFESFMHSVSTRREDGCDPIDFFSVCSPNYLHHSHIAAGLRSGCDVICEKPLVTHVAMLEQLQKLEQHYGRRVYSILQLRLHDAIRAVRKKVEEAKSANKHDVVLTYITSRGQWYHQSWKGDQRRSEGLVTNIGIHFFDMLQFVFGQRLESRVFLREESRASGYLEYENARVQWFLSIDSQDLPSEVVGKKTTFRNISIDGEPLEFSDGFTELHRASYADVLAGGGFGLDAARPSIEAVESIRTASLDSGTDLRHPFVARFT